MTGTAITVSDTRPAAVRRRLRARTVAVSALDGATRARAFALFQHAYQGADRARFEHDLDEKQLIILLCDRDTGEVEGFSTVLLREAAELASPGRRAPMLVFSGDTVINRAYWGQKQLQVAFIRILVRLLLRAPGRPLYWFLISKGWRTYLLLANAFPRAVPRHDASARDAARLLPVLDAVARQRFADQYHPESGVIRYSTPHERVRDGVAPLTPDLLANKHVCFFAERNPRHAEGEELACLALVRPTDLARVALRIVRSTLRRLLSASPDVRDRRGCS